MSILKAESIIVTHLIQVSRSNAGRLALDLFHRLRYKVDGDGIGNMTSQQVNKSQQLIDFYRFKDPLTAKQGKIRELGGLQRSSGVACEFRFVRLTLSHSHDDTIDDFHMDAPRRRLVADCGRRRHGFFAKEALADGCRYDVDRIWLSACTVLGLVLLPFNDRDSTVVTRVERLTAHKQKAHVGDSFSIMRFLHLIRPVMCVLPEVASPDRKVRTMLAEHGLRP